MISAEPLTDLCRAGIAERIFPGAAFAVGTLDVALLGAVGRHTYAEDSIATEVESLFDLASLTKVVATTTAAMLAHDDGLLDLDAPVVELLPEFVQGGTAKAEVRVRHLLLHCSGLPAYSTFHQRTRSPQEAREAVWGLRLEYPIEQRMVYSCMGFISLQTLLEGIFHQSLDAYLRERVWEPLGMRDTLYNPPEDIHPRCVPTEQDARRGLIQGSVHDPAAFAMGGVSGNAGLFSTVIDLAKFCRMMLRLGDAGGRQLVCSQTVEEWTRLHGPAGSTRALGWDTKSARGSSAGSKFSMRSYGHTGFTGTTIWIDPENEIYAVLLTNRVHPTSDNPRITAFRPRFHDRVFDVLKG